MRTRSPDDSEKPNILRDQEAYGENTHVKSEAALDQKSERERQAEYERRESKRASNSESIIVREFDKKGQFQAVPLHGPTAFAPSIYSYPYQHPGMPHYYNMYPYAGLGPLALNSQHYSNSTQGSQPKQATGSKKPSENAADGSNASEPKAQHL